MTTAPPSEESGLAPAVSLILTGADSAVTLANQAERLVQSLPANHEIVLVVPESAELLPGELTTQAGNSVTVVTIGEHPSESAKRAAGARHATAEVLLFCSMPMDPDADWTTALLEQASLEGVGAAGPVLAPSTDPTRWVGGLKFVDAALNIEWLAPPAGPTPVPLLGGACLAIRRSVLDEIGGWDEAAGTGFDNLDLCLRLWRSGYQCLIVRDSRVVRDFGSNPPEAFDWTHHLSNLIRLGIVHLDPDDLASTVRALSAHPAFAEAFAEVVSSDAVARRHQIAARTSESGSGVLRRLNGDLFKVTPPDTTASSSPDSPRAAQAESSLGTEWEAERQYLSVNRQAWGHWAVSGTHTSRVVEADEFAFAKELLDPDGWIVWESVRDVLCLGGGGGQQAPLMASLGCRVTLLDLSPGQLALDRTAMSKYGLSYEIVEGDMLDLSVLARRRFDLVYQPISTCYVPEVVQVYRQVASVLPIGGRYLVEHWNPFQIQLDERGRWDGEGYRLAHPQIAGQPVPFSTTTIEGAPFTAWHYPHSFADLIGGLPRTGFSIEAVAERPPGDLGASPGTDAHLAAYIPPFIRILARKSEEVAQPS